MTGTAIFIFGTSPKTKRPAFAGLFLLFDRCRPITTPRAIRLTTAIDDAALGEIVWRQLNGDLIASQDADVVFAHLARDVRNHRVPVRELNSERGVGKGVNDTTFHLDGILFRHALSRD